MTEPIRITGQVPTYPYQLWDDDSTEMGGRVRIAAYLELPAVLAEFAIELSDVLEAADVRAEVFDSPDNLIRYTEVGRLLSVSARLTNCDHIGLLLGQRSRLATMGLAGRIALCAGTVGAGLRRFSSFFSLHNSAAIVSVINAGGFTRLVYAISTPGMGDTSQLQLGSMALSFNIMQDLCGPRWLPAVVTIASNAPSSLRPCQKFFRAPLRFNSDETSLIFESHWLDRPLPPLNPLERRRIEAEVRARTNALLVDFPTALRRILRRQLIVGDFSMDSIAAMLGIHRRTLDRKLKRDGLLYGEMLESVKCEVACQLLRDTSLQMQHVAESLHYSSAANFSTAFRRWTGVNPSEYRRQAQRSATQRY